MKCPSYLAVFSAVGLAALATASAIPVTDSDIEIVPRSVSVVHSTDLAVHNWTRFDVNAVDSSIPKTAVVLAVLYTNAQIVGYACGAGPIVCGITAMSAILVSFFTLFKESSGPAGTDSPARRAIDYSAIHDPWMPTESCSTLCQLKAGAPHGEWVPLGNTTIDNVFHDIHFHQEGTRMGLRAVQSSGSTVKRDDIYDDDGIVATYFWEDDNQQAYNDFDRSAVDGMASNIVNYMFDNQADIVCADLIDQDGAVNAGFATLGSNNQEVAIDPGDYDAALAYCLSGDPNTP